MTGIKEKNSFSYTLWLYGGPLLVGGIVILGLLYGSYKFFFATDQDLCADFASDLICDVEAENFKYGTFGGEATTGIPYPLFAVMPEVFSDYTPGPGGWGAFGLAWEQGKELPVGFSKKRLGFDRITQNCALCHTATYRLDPSDNPTIVPGGPNHTLRFDLMLDFIENAAQDARFNPDVLIPRMEARFDLGVGDKLLYRYLIIPFARKAIIEQSKQAEFRRAHDRPQWGPGRDAAFNLAKFILAGKPDDGTSDTTDFAPLWNLGARQGHALNWAGETPDAMAVIKDSALAFGVVAGPDFIEKTNRIYDYLSDLPAPKIPAALAPNRAQARLGEQVFGENCASCHGWDGGRLGTAIPMSEIGTDPERFNAWKQSDADLVNATVKAKGIVRSDLIKNIGYVAVPLDGIWLRGPYLHNGSVPNLTALLTPPARRPVVFFKGCDVFDAENVGFVSQASAMDGCTNPFSFDTRLRGNGNQGHDYGTDLSTTDRQNLIEYLKTL